MGNKYKDYQSALNYLQLDKLYDRREELCKRFALKCQKNEKTKNMFPMARKEHVMQLRNSEKYHVQYARTSRHQNLLNGS